MTIIVADTTCGLPRELLKQRGIPLVPQVVIFGEDAYHDEGQMDTETFLQKLKASPALPKTAAPEPPLCFPIFEEAKKKGESVVVVAPTSKASGTVRSAQTAAMEFPGLDVRVVDTLTISCNLGSMVLVADEKAGVGASHGVVTEQCKGGDDAHLCVLQVEAEKEAQALVEELKSKVFVSDIPIYELPPAIVVHAGPKAMGVGFFV